jgi:hypothetical protein
MTAVGHIEEEEGADEFAAGSDEMAAHRPEVSLLASQPMAVCRARFPVVVDRLHWCRRVRSHAEMNVWVNSSWKKKSV